MSLVVKIFYISNLPDILTVRFPETKNVSELDTRTPPSNLNDNNSKILGLVLSAARILYIRHKLYCVCVCVCVCVWERERETDKQTETDRQGQISLKGSQNVFPYVMSRGTLNVHK
jgi:hypothetical protein